MIWQNNYVPLSLTATANEAPALNMQADSITAVTSIAPAPVLNLPGATVQTLPSLQIATAAITDTPSQQAAAREVSSSSQLASTFSAAGLTARTSSFSAGAASGESLLNGVDLLAWQREYHPPA